MVGTGTCCCGCTCIYCEDVCGLAIEDVEFEVTFSGISDNPAACCSQMNTTVTLTYSHSVTTGSCDRHIFSGTIDDGMGCLAFVALALDDGPGDWDPLACQLTMQGDGFLNVWRKNHTTGIYNPDTVISAGCTITGVTPTVVRTAP